VVAVSSGPVATERLAKLMRKKAQDRTGNAENWRDLFKPLPFEPQRRRSEPPLRFSPPSTPATPAARSLSSTPAFRPARNLFEQRGP
jgi:hypothetical protein